MTHLLESCPTYCLVDSSNSNERQFACGLCHRNPQAPHTTINMGDRTITLGTTVIFDGKEEKPKT